MESAVEKMVSQLRQGVAVHRRFCGVCHEAIRYVLHKGNPALDSCPCRPAGASNLITLTWDELELLVAGQGA